MTLLDLLADDPLHWLDATPNIDDGVKVNIRPFQATGLLAMNEVIKKW